MSKIFLEYRVATRSPSWGIRILIGGQLYEWSKDNPEQDWKRIGKLTPKEQRSLKHVIRTSGFFSLPTEAADSANEMDGTSVHWTILNGTKQHHVVRRGQALRNELVLKKLDEYLQKIVGEVTEKK